jgi:tRNA threonylcarbamoyladenosine biosynthesis protein TsaE
MLGRRKIYKTIISFIDIKFCMEHSTIVTSLSELSTFTHELVEYVEANQLVSKEGLVIALSGDLGAGKTTLVQHIARELGIVEVVTSPTFTIMKRYITGDNQYIKELVHIDAYRIESGEEVRPLQLAPLFSTPGTLLCIEWAEKIAHSLPSNTIHIAITLHKNDVREINITESSLSV